MATGRVKDKHLDRESSPATREAVDRLMRELEQSREASQASIAQLEEEVAYYRGELEATRQRMERQSLRSQAEEVAKRRRAEEALADLRRTFRATQQERDKANATIEELRQQLVDQEEAARRHTREEVDKLRSASKETWRNAEKEAARLERELADALTIADDERERRYELEQQLKKATDRAEDAGRLNPETARLITGLKAALRASERARLKVQNELASMQASQATTSAASPQDALRAVYRVFSHPFGFRQHDKSVEPPAWNRGYEAAFGSPSQAGPFDPSDLEDTWQASSSGHFDGDLADEFLLVPSDHSLTLAASRGEPKEDPRVEAENAMEIREVTTVTQAHPASADAIEEVVPIPRRPRLEAVVPARELERPLPMEPAEGLGEKMKSRAATLFPWALAGLVMAFLVWIWY